MASEAAKVLRPDSELATASSGELQPPGVVAAIRIPMLKVSNFDGRKTPVASLSPKPRTGSGAAQQPYYAGGTRPACIKNGRVKIARRAIDLAEARLARDGWSKYFDDKLGATWGRRRGSSRHGPSRATWCPR